MLKSTLTVGLFVDHAKAVRIPLLIIALSAALTFWVDQIWELFLLLTTDQQWAPRIGALAMAGALGFAVWHTARTVYRFDIPTIPSLSDPAAQGLRNWLPRLLGAAIPVLMAVGSLTALRDPSLKGSTEDVSYWMPGAFFVEGAVLLLFFVVRRSLFSRITSLGKSPGDDPRVKRWSQLPRSVRAVYAVIVVANVLALYLAAEHPGWLSTMGTLAVVLMCASFLTVTGTFLTIQAARWQFPLLIFLFVLALTLQALGWNDNHRVRLSTQMHSYSSPSGAQVDVGAPIPGSFADYALGPNAAGTTSPVYLVSAEGGGIRAAAWTAAVLSELEIETHGEFSKHMLLGSGVSGGSLGLAWFAAIVRGERESVITLDDIATMRTEFYQTNFLGPTVETMFLTDFLQRFWVRPLFMDRGERLERTWESGWQASCLHRPSVAGKGSPPVAQESICSLFEQPWKQLWAQADHVPLLFLNSTEVQSGERFIEQPFTSIQGETGGTGFFNAALLSTNLLPASSPLSAVVHNSARFTYVSPAGTLYDASTVHSAHPTSRQLADGGYFDNSGEITTAELAELLARSYPQACAGPTGLANTSCPIRLIHISNDPALESMRSNDRCANEYGPPPPAIYGEIRAPLMAVLSTRDAHAEVARAAARGLFSPTGLLSAQNDTSTDLTVFHFRLCHGTHHLPLGWTISAEALGEMQHQLTDPAFVNAAQLKLIGEQLRTPAGQ